MGDNTKIEWADKTFNPWIGCTKVSPACDHCYAEAWDKRFGGERWGPHAPRKRTKTWGNPVKWQKRAEAEGTRYRVFCASLADVFDNHKTILDEWRHELWLMIERTPNLDWLLLTKRPQNVNRFIPPSWRDMGWPENVWLGTTVEDQTEAERRVPSLLATGARIKFLSCEPLIGPVDIRAYLPGCFECSVECGWRSGQPPAVEVCHHCGWQGENAGEFCPNCGRQDFGHTCPDCHSKVVESHPDTPCLDWIIAGGESGTRYRPVDPDWFRSLRDQCAAAGTNFLFKQWEGRNQKEIKAKGRELDGVVHDGYPV